MDPECKLKSPKSTVKKIIEAKEFQKEQAHFTPTSPRKNRTVCPDYVQECIQWRKWRKIASLWPFELEAKSGPLETGDLGEIRHFRQNRQFPKGPFAISFEFLSTVWRFWGLIAISAIFANACISGHISVDVSRMIIANSQMQEYMKSAAAFLNLPTIIHLKQLWFIWKKDERL